MKKIFLTLLVLLLTLITGCSQQQTEGRSDQADDNSGGVVANMSSADITGQSSSQTEPGSAGGGNRPSADTGDTNDQTVSNVINNNPSNMPEMIIDQNKTYTALIKTEAGDMEISLNAMETPITANNFVWLAKKGFYDGTIFHRVMKGFMIQGGDPKGDGTGGPGYQFKDEPFTGEYTRGTIAMANAGPDTNGSQFFIMHANYPLPKNYVIFGQVIKGLDTLDKIANATVTMSSMGEASKPISPVKINSVEIIEK